MKIAIVHDYLVNRGGSERVALAMHEVWPDAPIFTSLYHPEATHDGFRSADVRPSRLQRFSKDPAAFRRLMPLFPRAFSSMDLSGYDVVLCSSAAFAHHVRPPRGACMVVYAYSPPRFLWGERHELVSNAPRWARPILPAARAYLRRLDRAAYGRVHRAVSVSRVTEERMQRVYGIHAPALYPPVNVERFHAGLTRTDEYLFVGRLMAHRRVDLAVEAFTRANVPLAIVGDGPVRAELEAIAGPTIRFLGAVSDDELIALYAACRGVVVPGLEDFGLIPLEANAAGAPALARDEGGARETVVDGVTGILFSPPTAEGLLAGLKRAQEMSVDAAALRAHAERFSGPVFASKIRALVEDDACPRCGRGGHR